MRVHQNRYKLADWLYIGVKCLGIDQCRICAYSDRDTAFITNLLDQNNNSIPQRACSPRRYSLPSSARHLQNINHHHHLRGVQEVASLYLNLWYLVCIASNNSVQLLGGRVQFDLGIVHSNHNHHHFSSDHSRIPYHVLQRHHYVW